MAEPSINIGLPLRATIPSVKDGFSEIDTFFVLVTDIVSVKDGDSVIVAW